MEEIVLQEYKVQLYKGNSKDIKHTKIKANLVRFIGNGGLEFTNSVDGKVIVLNNGTWRRVDFGENRQTEGSGLVKVDSEPPFYAQVRITDPSHNMVLFVNMDSETVDGTKVYKPISHIILSESAYTVLEMDEIVQDKYFVDQLQQQRQQAAAAAEAAKKQGQEVDTKSIPVQQVNQNPTALQ